MAKYEQDRARMMAATAQRRLRFKLYKAGGQWVIAGIAAVTLGLAVGGQPVSAATTADTAGTVAAPAAAGGTTAPAKTTAATAVSMVTTTDEGNSGEAQDAEAATGAAATETADVVAPSAVGAATGAAATATGTTPTSEAAETPTTDTDSYHVEYVNVTEYTGNNRVEATVEGNAADGPYQVDLAAAGLDPAKYELADPQQTSLQVEADGTYQIEVKDKTKVLDEPLVVKTTIHYVAAEADDPDWTTYPAGDKTNRLADNQVLAAPVTVEQRFTVTWDLARDEGVWYEPTALFSAVTSPTVDGMVPTMATFPNGDLRMGGTNIASNDTDVYVTYHPAGVEPAATYAAPTFDEDDAAAGVVTYRFVDLDNGGNMVATYTTHATAFNSRPEMLTFGADGVGTHGVVAELAALYDYDPAGFAAEGGRADGRSDETSAQGEVIDSVAAGSHITIELRHRHKIVPVLFTQLVHFQNADGETVADDQKWNLGWEVDTDLVRDFGFQRHGGDYAPTYTPIDGTGQPERPIQQIDGTISTIDGVATTKLAAVSYLGADGTPHDAPEVTVVYDNHPYTIEFFTTTDRGHQVTVGKPYLGQAKDGSYQIDLADAGLDPAKYELSDPTTTSLTVAPDQTYRIEVKHRTQILTDEPVVIHRPVRYVWADDETVEVAAGIVIDQTYLKEVDLVTGNPVMYHLQNLIPDLPNPEVAGMVAERPTLLASPIQETDSSWEYSVNQTPIVIRYDAQPYTVNFFYTDAAGQTTTVGTHLGSATFDQGTYKIDLAAAGLDTSVYQLADPETTSIAVAPGQTYQIEVKHPTALQPGKAIITHRVIHYQRASDHATLHDDWVMTLAYTPEVDLITGRILRWHRQSEMPDVTSPTIPGYVPDQPVLNLTELHIDHSNGTPVDQLPLTVYYTPDVQKASVYFVGEGGLPLVPAMQIEGPSGSAIAHTRFVDTIQKLISGGYNLVADGTVGATFDQDAGVDQYFVIKFEAVAPMAGIPGGGVHVYQKAQVPDVAPSVTDEGYYNNLTPGTPGEGIHVYQKTQVPDTAPSVTETDYYNNLTPGTPGEGIHVYQKTQVPDVAPSVTDEGYYNNLTPGTPGDGIHVYQKTQVPDVAPSVTDEGYYNNLIPGELDDGVRVRSQVPDDAPTVTEDDYYNNLIPGELDAGVRVRSQVPDVAPSVTDEGYYNNLIPGELDDGVRVRSQVPDVAPTVTEDVYYNNQLPGELDDGVRVRSQVPDVAPSVTKAAYYDHRTATPTVTPLADTKRPTTGTPKSLPVTGPQRPAATATAATATAPATKAGTLPQTGEATRGALALAGVGLLSLLGLAALAERKRLAGKR
ncbi:mucin-binding protein [Lacticaseibacillus kribbianus]|uniref:mucin-binding protein n=1 Tax=Lacticaseibacillus kribbianus TaxID=2926292 RepID=UPI001CD1B803|nr:KxYKxGKxW signal peptide domain-containing protein [Lacticaseibacillus kribbianus]